MEADTHNKSCSTVKNSGTIHRLYITGIILLLTTFFVIWVFHPSLPANTETLPTKVLIEKPSPDKKIQAQIIEGEKIESLNMLGSNTRYYLLIEYPNSKHLVVRELSEGFGSYEGGIVGLEWLDSKRILINRYVSDRKADIVYDISKNKWQLIENQ